MLFFFYCSEIEQWFELDFGWLERGFINVKAPMSISSLWSIVQKILTTATLAFVTAAMVGADCLRCSLIFWSIELCLLLFKLQVVGPRICLAFVTWIMLAIFTFETVGYWTHVNLFCLFGGESAGWRYYKVRPPVGSGLSSRRIKRYWSVHKSRPLLFLLSKNLSGHTRRLTD